MECVYNAANTLEGQLAVDLLQGAGIDARMDGEYLQGGIGELQALGLIRVMVGQADAAKAREIMRKWDQKRSPERVSDRQAAPKKALVVAVGVVVGVCLAFVLLILDAR